MAVPCGSKASRVTVHAMTGLRRHRFALGFVLAPTLFGCSASPAPQEKKLSDVLTCSFGDGQGAPSTCLTPKQAPEYYVEQAQKYFDTLDVSADPKSIPTYSELSARWEWPPWLRLTGYGRAMLLDTAVVVRKDAPSTIPKRDCRAFAEQPFARCTVSFDYAEGSCPIYEEFTFNDTGEMTFIEAWSNLPGLTPTSAADPWAESTGIHRLSTRVPGLGKADGRIDPAGPWMTEAASLDAEVADFAERAQNFWPTWLAELGAVQGDVYALGCGW